MSSAALTTIGQVLAILIGSGAVGGGFWKFARNVLRHALAAEQARNTAAAAAQTNAENTAATRELLANHETRLTRVEGHLWPNLPSSTARPPISAPTVPSRQADIRARL